jgi:hypothetical protein
MQNAFWTQHKYGKIEHIVDLLKITPEGKDTNT